MMALRTAINRWWEANVAPHWQRVRGVVATRERRERILMVFVIGSVPAALWYVVFLQPTLEQMQVAESRTTSAEARGGELALKLTEMLDELEADPDQRESERIAELRAELEELETEITRNAPEFVDTAHMRTVLERMVRADSDVRLIQLESLPAVALVRPTEAVEEEDGEANETPSTEGMVIYRHTIRLVFEADYAATLRYLRAVENLPWRLGWESIDYVVVAHPVARVEIRMNTLSGQEAWIGV